MRKILFIFFVYCSVHLCYAQNADNTVISPDSKIVVTFSVDQASYAIAFQGVSILKNSRLGLLREDEDFTRNLKLIKISPAQVVQDHYTMLTAKKKDISYTATKRIVEVETPSGKRMNIVFQVSNDGVAFRYEFPDTSTDVKKIVSEATSFHFHEGTRAWLQPKAEAQTGFEHTNPSYEAHYMMDIPTGTPSPNKNGWVYPAMFNYNNVWMLVTEAGLGRSYCGTALQQHSPDSEYKINFPQSPEIYTSGALNPASALPWKTPWRIVAIGNLKTLVESTLGTDLAFPAKKNGSFLY